MLACGIKAAQKRFRSLNLYGFATASKRMRPSRLVFRPTVEAHHAQANGKRQVPLPRDSIPPSMIVPQVEAKTPPGPDVNLPRFFVAINGADMKYAGRTLVWWDRDIDQTGRPIRADVRVAAHEIWLKACQRTQALLDDHGPAAELMETSVAEISRYLDRIGAPESSQKHGLLMVAFSRGLRRYVAKLNRLQLVGSSGELAGRALDEACAQQMNVHLELATILRKLSDENGSVLMLRAAGYQWEEIGQILEKSPATIRISFWREIRKIRRSCNYRR